jgi:hypothetical protein
MNAISSITKPCATVQEWLACHEVTRCPTAYALGLSDIEDLTGLVSNDGLPWRETIRRQNEAAARHRLGAKYRPLRSSKK